MTVLAGNFGSAAPVIQKPSETFLDLYAFYERLPEAAHDITLDFREGVALSSAGNLRRTHSNSHLPYPDPEKVFEAGSNILRLAWEPELRQAIESEQVHSLRHIQEMGVSVGRISFNRYRFSDPRTAIGGYVIDYLTVVSTGSALQGSELCLSLVGARGLPRSPSSVYDVKGRAYVSHESLGEEPLPETKPETADILEGIRNTLKRLLVSID